MSKVKCEHCDTDLFVEDRKIGQVAKCPKCGKQTKLELTDELAENVAAESVQKESMVFARCQRCNESINVDQSDRGRIIECPNCHKQTRVEINPVSNRAKLTPKTDYRSNYSLVDIYATITQFAGWIALIPSVVSLLASSSKENDQAFCFYVAVGCAILGFWFLVLSQLLKGFVTVFVSAEITADAARRFLDEP